MKKLVVAVLMMAMGWTALPSVSYAEAGLTEDTIVDKAGDWFATMGKPQDEKDQIIAQRRAERAADRFKNMMNRGADKAGKDMDKLGKKMEKALQ